MYFGDDYMLTIEKTTNYKLYMCNIVHIEYQICIHNSIKIGN